MYSQHKNNQLNYSQHRFSQHKNNEHRFNQFKYSQHKNNQHRYSHSQHRYNQHTLVEIGQNVTIIFVITCNYYLVVTGFGHFCNYFLCWSYL